MKKMQQYKKDYETTQTYAMVLALIGWGILLVGIIYPIVTEMFWRAPDLVVLTYYALVIIIGVFVYIFYYKRWSVKLTDGRVTCYHAPN